MGAVVNFFLVSLGGWGDSVGGCMLFEVFENLELFEAFEGIAVEVARKRSRVGAKGNSKRP